MRNVFADNNNNMSTVNMREERTMGKFMKTGIIAAGTFAAAGLALGMSPVSAHAAETDTNDLDAATQVSCEMTAPKTTEDARSTVDVAQEEAETTDVAVEEAERRVNEAQTAFYAASEAADTARSEAEKAFEDAKAEAADADSAAGNDVVAAESNVTEAEGRVQQAEEDVASAEEALLEAEDKVLDTASENPVTETDISEKESELTRAEADLADAEKAFEEAESARNEAFEEAQQKESARDDARNTVKEAETEKEEADAATASAEDMAGQANQALQSAEGLKNGTLDIKDTVQYKEKQKAKEMMDKAAKAAGTAAEAADKAAADLSKAGATVDAAGKELDQAAKDLNNTESELSEAEKVKRAADFARENAKAAYDEAAVRAADADTAFSFAEKNVTEAKNGVKTAEAAKNTADKAVKKAEDAVTAARKDAEAAVNVDITAAEKEIREKRTATEEAQKALDSATERYKQGTLGLIDWMLEKDDLTQYQIQDLTYARKVLIRASEEDFTKWYGGDNTGLPKERNGKIVVIGDENDATDLENLLKSIEIMKEINELRAADDNYTGNMQRTDSYTNFFHMATAEAEAMRGAGLLRHVVLSTSCENLSFGYNDPTIGWYDEEKAEFDRIRDDLGITKITSMDDVERIGEEAKIRDVEVGHYTNLFWDADQVMGVGYTQYRRTYCYSASYASSFRTNRYNRAMHLYTVDEFEKLVADYYQSVDKSACEDTFRSASVAQAEAENRLQTLTEKKDAAVESAIKRESSILSVRKSEAEAAALTLDDARKTLADAEKASLGAQAAKNSADQALQSALTTFDKASDESRAADAGIVYAEKARNDAGKSLAEAKSALKNAEAGRKEAASILEEKKAALTDANTSLHSAAALYTEAEKKLADLTSDDTLDALRKQKLAADSTLQSALENQSVKDKTLKQASVALALAETAASGAKTSLQEADMRLAEAAGARDSAKKSADQAAHELEDLRAAAALGAARENLRRAEEVRNSAKSDLSMARTGLTEAQTAKAITADKLLRATGLSVDAALLTDIEDPDFTYLNGYIDAIKAADTELHSAREGLDNANAELSSRKADNENAHKAYIAALADLAIAQDRMELSQVNSDTVHDSTFSVETAVCIEGAAPDMSFDASEVTWIDSGNAVSGTTLNTDRTTIKETASVATGDTSNILAWLAGLLASTGFMILGLRKKKEVKERKVH